MKKLLPYLLIPLSKLFDNGITISALTTLNTVVQLGGTSVSIPLNSSGTTTITIVKSSYGGSASENYTFLITK
jgi:hypothetical protein